MREGGFEVIELLETLPPSPKTKTLQTTDTETLLDNLPFAEFSETTDIITTLIKTCKSKNKGRHAFKNSLKKDSRFREAVENFNGRIDEYDDWSQPSDHVSDFKTTLNFTQSLSFFNYSINPILFKKLEINTPKRLKSEDASGLVKVLGKWNDYESLRSVVRLVGESVRTN